MQRINGPASPTVFGSNEALASAYFSSIWDSDISFEKPGRNLQDKYYRAVAAATDPSTTEIINYFSRCWNERKNNSKHFTCAIGIIDRGILST